MRQLDVYIVCYMRKIFLKVYILSKRDRLIWQSCTLLSINNVILKYLLCHNTLDFKRKPTKWKTLLFSWTVFMYTSFWTIHQIKCKRCLMWTFYLDSHNTYIKSIFRSKNSRFLLDTRMRSGFLLCICKPTHNTFKICFV